MIFSGQFYSDERITNIYIVNSPTSLKIKAPIIVNYILAFLVIKFVLT